jgi:hypothetical protein
VKEAAHALNAVQPKTFYSEGIRKLVQQRTTCVEKQGNVFENDVNVNFLFVFKYSL